MRVFACCAASFHRSVRRAAGVEPLLSPPVDLAAFQPGWLGGFGLLYFKLHGLAGQPYWYGDGWLTALSVDAIRQADLSGAVVFVANCFLEESPMLPALLSAGARAVIGGSGPNYARSAAVDGADLLGLWLRRGLMAGFPVRQAFGLAKERLRFNWQSPAVRDALAFKLFE